MQASFDSTMTDRRMLRGRLLVPALALTAALAALPAAADPVSFSTGLVDGRMAAASRPDTPGKFEIETGDDFVVSNPTSFSHASFTGLLVGADAADITQILTEIYRVFPNDSDTGRTPQVPTRTNSPSDIALDSRSSGSGGLNFTVSVLSSVFTTANSVQPGGIHASPNATTGGNGSLTGIEILIDVDYSSELLLDPDHYFFVPQVATTRGDFYWLSSTRPIVPPGTPFAPDLQGWTRDAQLDPDWLRVGTDIVGGSPAPTFNFAFTLDGQTVPEPSTPALMLLVAGVAMALRRRAVDRC